MIYLLAVILGENVYWIGSSLLSFDNGNIPIVTQKHIWFPYLLCIFFYKKGNKAMIEMSILLYLQLHGRIANVYYTQKQICIYIDEYT